MAFGASERNCHQYPMDVAASKFSVDGYCDLEYMRT